MRHIQIQPQNVQYADLRKEAWAFCAAINAATRAESSVNHLVQKMGLNYKVFGLTLGILGYIAVSSANWIIPDQPSNPIQSDFESETKNVKAMNLHARTSENVIGSLESSEKFVPNVSASAPLHDDQEPFEDADTNALKNLEVYRRGSIKNPPSCDPLTNVYPCGSLEFIGCSGSKKYYAESIIRLNWFEAWEYCRSHQMHLASIETRYEQSFLELFLPRPDTTDKPAYWVSATDAGREGLFMWMATGKSLTYTNWQSSEQNNRRGREHCVQMVATQPDFENFKWNDNICTSVAFAICQKEYVFHQDGQGQGQAQGQSHQEWGSSGERKGSTLKGSKNRNKIKKS